MNIHRKKYFALDDAKSKLGIFTSSLSIWRTEIKE